MSCKKRWKWHFWDPKFKNFLEEYAPRPPRLGRLHRYNFSPRVRTPSGYLHQCEKCKRIVRWWCMTCGTTELSRSTGAIKATTETKLRLQLVRANAFCLRLSWCFLLLVLLANCGIDHILKERRKPGADPGFFLGGGAPLRDGMTDRWRKQILRANTVKFRK